MTAKQKITKKSPKKAFLSQKPVQLKTLGVKISLITKKDSLSLLSKWIKSNKQYQISTPNPEQIILAQKNKRFRDTLNRSDITLIDGAGLEWAVQRLLNTLPTSSAVKNFAIERIPGVDFMLSACNLAEKQGWRVFLLGGKKGSASQAAVKLRQQFPDLLVSSWQGANDIKQETREDNRLAIEQINRFRPHLLFVAYGAPHQELWIKKNLPKLKTKVGMSVGGALDYIAGNVRRAPLWARRAGFEWLFRLWRQPFRFTRQLKAAGFFWLVLRQKKV